MSPYYEDDLVTLYHGDCLEVAEWLAADVLVTDPPYGIPGGRLSSHRTARPAHEDVRRTSGLAESVGQLDLSLLVLSSSLGRLHRSSTSQQQATRKDATRDARWDDLGARDAALSLWGDRPRAVFGSPKVAAVPHRGVPLIWDKGDSPGMGDYTWPFGATYEVVWVLGDGWSGRRRSSVLRCVQPSNAASLEGHPTPKPVQLMEVLLSYAPAGVIADPFAGSGSTLVAAKQLGRRAIGVELEERYCEIAAKRLAQDVLDFGEATA